MLELEPNLAYNDVVRPDAEFLLEKTLLNMGITEKEAGRHVVDNSAEASGGVRDARRTRHALHRSALNFVLDHLKDHFGLDENATIGADGTVLVSGRDGRVNLVELVDELKKKRKKKSIRI